MEVNIEIKKKFGGMRKEKGLKMTKCEISIMRRKRCTESGGIDIIYNLTGRYKLTP